VCGCDSQHAYYVVCGTHSASGRTVVHYRKTVDGVIAKYNDELQRIYDDRTAGDHTFTGVLSKFLIDIRELELS